MEISSGVLPVWRFVGRLPARCGRHCRHNGNKVGRSSPPARRFSRFHKQKPIISTLFKIKSANLKWGAFGNHISTIKTLIRYLINQQAFYQSFLYHPYKIQGRFDVFL
jgi:hypothetical protein